MESSKASDGTQTLTRSQYIAQAGMIGALYAAFTLVVMLVFQSFSWGPIQFRISEAICVFALFTPAAIPGLTVGCAIANGINIAISGTGLLGLLDVVFGSVATLIGAILCWRFRSRPALGLLFFVLSNALIVSAYLPLLLYAIGALDTTTFTPATYLGLYCVYVLSTGAGEAAVMYILGLPLSRLISKSKLLQYRQKK